MLTPIQKEHEICCPSCGCVLAEINDYQEKSEKPLIPPSLNMLFLGSAMVNTEYAFNKTAQQVHEERTLRQLNHIIKEFALPDRFVIETFTELKRKKSGFQSEKKPIKQLLQILSKDENYYHIHKMRAIKERYKTILGM
jgi:hypothetical protein